MTDFISFISLYFKPLLILAGTMSALGLLAFLVFRLRLYRAALRRHHDINNVDPEVGVTVVICCHNEGEALETNVPKIMEQRGVKFEVVVVDDCSTDSTSDALKRMEARYPNLRHTFVPNTARYVSHEKLAISLGVKAARYEWVVLTRPSCTPQTDLWLKSLASCFAPEKDIVTGYANYADNHTAPARRAVFERLQYSMLWLLSAQKRAIGGDGANLAFRRQAFLDADGYAESLDRLFGTDDLLVLALSSRGNATTCLHPSATVRDFQHGLRHKWRERKLMRTASLLYRPRRLSAAIIARNLANLGHYLWLAGFVIAAATLGILQNWIALGGVCLAVIAVSLADILMMRKVSRALGERTYIFSLMWYELTRPLSYGLWKLRARLHRRDFIRKI